jgi:hypothetical protein
LDIRKNSVFARDWLLRIQGFSFVFLALRFLRQYKPSTITPIRRTTPPPTAPTTRAPGATGAAPKGGGDGSGDTGDASGVTVGVEAVDVVVGLDAVIADESVPAAVNAHAKRIQPSKNTWICQATPKSTMS